VFRPRRCYAPSELDSCVRKLSLSWLWGVDINRTAAAAAERIVRHPYGTASSCAVDILGQQSPPPSPLLSFFSSLLPFKLLRCWEVQRTCWGGFSFSSVCACLLSYSGTFLPPALKAFASRFHPCAVHSLSPSLSSDVMTSRDFGDYSSRSSWVALHLTGFIALLVRISIVWQRARDLGYHLSAQPVGLWSGTLFAISLCTHVVGASYLVSSDTRPLSKFVQAVVWAQPWFSITALNIAGNTDCNWLLRSSVSPQRPRCPPSCSGPVVENSACKPTM